MHDPNFERTVQQKMEELQFHPADSVWVNIEKAVAGQRRHRGLPFFWRFALPVFLAAAATGVYYFSARRIDRAFNNYPMGSARASSIDRAGNDRAVDRPAADKVVSAPAIADGSAAIADGSATIADGSAASAPGASRAKTTDPGPGRPLRQQANVKKEGMNKEPCVRCLSRRCLHWKQERQS
jgi:hypothetical protein